MDGKRENYQRWGTIMEKEKLSETDTRDYMGGMGNVGYLWSYIDYFEKALEDEITSNEETDEPALLNCPNFAAWLRFYTEVICNKVLIELHRAEQLQKRVKQYKFGSAVIEIVKILDDKLDQIKIDKHEFEKMQKAIKLVVELRHTVQHGGIPNILRDISFKDDVSEEDIQKMMVPQNYKETKIIFNDANKLIEFLPSPTIISYRNGHVELREPKK